LTLEALTPVSKSAHVRYALPLSARTTGCAKPAAPLIKQQPNNTTSATSLSRSILSRRPDLRAPKQHH
jgi:hypothetical protein